MHGKVTVYKSPPCIKHDNLALPFPKISIMHPSIKWAHCTRCWYTRTHTYASHTFTSNVSRSTIHLNNCAHGSCLIVLLCGKPNSPISHRVASLALGQSYDCPSASEATLKNIREIYPKWMHKNRQYYTKPSIKSVSIYYGIYWVYVYGIYGI